MAQGINVAAAMQAASPPIVASIHIHMTADGNVMAKCEVPNRQVLVMMLELTKLDMNQRMQAKPADGPQIEVPGQGGILIAQPG